MKCKRCNKEITGDEVRKVADWPFCQTCFEQLMNPPEEPLEKGDEAKEETAVSEKTTRKTQCQVCEKSFSPGEVKKVGIWYFCSSCHGDLVFRPKPPAAPPEGETADKQADEEPEEEAIGRARVQFMQFVHCHACGRRIPEGGSKEVEGEYYCPDCYRKLPEAQRESGEPQKEEQLLEQKSGVVSSAKETMQNICESCGRNLPKKRLKHVEGFMVCETCLSTDPDLALQIARDRHRQLMKRKMQDFES